MCMNHHGCPSGVASLARIRGLPALCPGNNCCLDSSWPLISRPAWILSPFFFPSVGSLVSDTDPWPSGLCQRRRWPEPAYQVSCSPSGYRCVVRVNNREYQTPTYHPSETSAKEHAALIAFNICRNFSANDGMYPTGFAHGGVIQGNPVPVGSGRRSSRRAGTDARSEYRYGDSDSTGSRSGGSSPDWGESRLSDPLRGSSTRRSMYSSDSMHYGGSPMPRY